MNISRGELAAYNVLLLQGESGPSYLLDDYPAQAAFSFRKLKTGQTNCCRVLRSGDSLESDFGFTSGDVVDISAIVDWVVAGGGTQNGYITKMYDPMGNCDFPITVANDQPRIVASGVAVTGDTGKTGMDIATNGHMLSPSGMGLDDTAGTIFYAGELDNSADGMLARPPGGGGFLLFSVNGNNSGMSAFSGLSLYQNGSSVAWTTRNHVHDGMLNTPSILTIEDVDFTIDSEWNTGQVNIFNGQITTRGWQGVQHEMIFYNSDQSANREAIETNMNEFYGFY